MTGFGDRGRYATGNSMKWTIAHPDERKACRLIAQAGGAVARESWRPFISRIRSINLRDSSASDRLLESIPALPSLSFMELGTTRITDSGVSALARHPKLHYLYLWGNELTDNCVEYLAKIPLFMLNVESTQISFDACKRLSEQLPECLVCHSRTKKLFRGKFNADDPYQDWLERDGNAELGQSPGITT